jgi:hypothetical protein
MLLLHIPEAYETIVLLDFLDRTDGCSLTIDDFQENEVFIMRNATHTIYATVNKGQQ